MEKLGFKFTDIKIILGSHAHGDHMEGDALVKELSGGQVMAMAQDVPALERMRPGGKPHPIDRVLRDGEEVKLLKPDVPLGSHPAMYRMAEKFEKIGRGPNPFIDPEGYTAELDLVEGLFLQVLAEQQKAAGVR